MRHGPAFGHDGPSEPEPAGPAGETPSQLERRTEAMLALAIVVPVGAVYGAAAYGVYLAVSALV
jgi:hypothetical protein